MVMQETKNQTRMGSVGETAVTLHLINRNRNLKSEIWRTLIRSGVKTNRPGRLK
jgi:hypothetical protein